jgi:hypothetical protein
MTMDMISDLFSGSFTVDVLTRAVPAEAAAAPRPAAGSIVSWDSLSEPLQLTLGRGALRRAAETIALQAEALAGEMEVGGLDDRGGPDALRLLAAVVRVTSDQGLA